MSGRHILAVLWITLHYMCYDNVYGTILPPGSADVTTAGGAPQDTGNIGDNGTSSMTSFDCGDEDCSNDNAAGMIYD